ncbi:MAG: type I DNA topoisomerase [Clostridia bacterium]|nr:type I DNA topoisomerase [Clostridia bacterium]
MDLVIVESPHKAKTIAKYLGREYQVLASGGHVRDLPEHSMGVDIEHGFKPEYVVTDGKKATIDTLGKAIAKADRVYLATDPDREGEAISWHLAQVFNLPEDDIRIEFNEISKKAVLNALKRPRHINDNLVDAQQARRVLDRLVGYKLSPILSRKIKSGLSAGRVQSVSLKMIVDREREILNFKPEEYWNIFAMLNKGGDSAIHKCEFYDIDGKKLKVDNKELADSIVAGSKAGEWSVESVKRDTSVNRPAPPFTTSTMQQDGASKLGLTPPKIMQIAQQLYEGVDIPGMGHTALVTYIRTDSVRVSDDAQREAIAHIKSVYGDAFAPDKPNFYKTKSGSQDAHEAIRPISLEADPEALKDKLERNVYKLYKLIYDRFVASQMAPAQYDTLTVRVVSHSDKEYGYLLKGRTLKFLGWRAAYTPAGAEKEEKDAKTLPDISEGERFMLKEMKAEQKFTTPPPRYTDATLVKGMEDNGIGRPSTYAATITVLSKRAYIDKDGKSIVPTQLGETVCDMLVKYFPNIMDVKFTSDMELDLDKIEEGGVQWQKILQDFYPDFIDKCHAAHSDSLKMRPKAEESDEICEKCGARMVIRESKFGKFLACPNYPNCKFTKPYGGYAAVCPKCGKGILRKVSKKGKVFYSCSGYPDCDFISWDLPAPHFCPQCKSTMRISGSGEKRKYVCVDRNCGYIEPAPEAETSQESEE